MVTLPSSVIVPALRLMRANRVFVTAEGARRHVRERELRPTPYGPPSRLRRDVRVTVSGAAWPVYTITPVGGTPSGSVVYVHGGGWVNQIAGQHWHLAAQIAAEANTTVTVPIYPLVPFGTAAAVAAGVVDLVRGNLERYGSTRLAGDSAGGQIALSAALVLRDEHDITLRRTVLISPPLTSPGATRSSPPCSRATPGWRPPEARCSPISGRGPTTSWTRW